MLELPDREILDPALVSKIVSGLHPVLRKLMLGMTVTHSEYAVYGAAVRMFEEHLIAEKTSRMRYVGADAFKLTTDLDSEFCIYGESRHSGRRFFGAVNEEARDTVNPPRQDHFPEKVAPIYGMTDLSDMIVSAAFHLGKCKIKDRHCFVSDLKERKEIVNRSTEDHNYLVRMGWALNQEQPIT
jgi:hypothetical protein